MLIKTGHMTDVLFTSSKDQGCAWLMPPPPIQHDVYRQHLTRDHLPESSKNVNSRLVLYAGTKYSLQDMFND